MKKKKRQKTHKKDLRVSKTPNWIIEAVFFLILLFIYQYQFPYVGEDFKVYILNGEYLLNKFLNTSYGNSWYFEPNRAYVVPLFFSVIEGLLFLFSKNVFLVRNIAIFIFILSNLLFFVYSLRKFCEGFKINKIIFFVFMANPFFIQYALREGTELLHLSVLMIAFSNLIKAKQSGFWFGLSSMIRFESILYLIFIIFPIFSKDKLNKKIKRIVKDLIGALIPLTIFGIITGVFYALPFQPLIDSYFFNIYLHDYLFEPLRVKHFESVLIFLIPSILIFAYSLFYDRKNFQKNMLIGSLLIFIVLRFAYTPIKIERYLFLIVLPCSYFLTNALEKIFYNLENKFLIYVKYVILLVIFLVSFVIGVKMLNNYTSYQQFEENILKDAISNINPNQALETNYHISMIFLTQNLELNMRIFPMLRHLNFSETLNCYNVLLVYPKQMPDWKEEYWNITERFKELNPEEFFILKKDHYIYLEKLNDKMNCPYEKTWNYFVIDILRKRVDISYYEMLKKIA